MWQQPYTLEAIRLTTYHMHGEYLSAFHTLQNCSNKATDFLKYPVSIDKYVRHYPATDGPRAPAFDDCLLVRRSPAAPTLVKQSIGAASSDTLLSLFLMYIHHDGTQCSSNNLGVQMDASSLNNRLPCGMTEATADAVPPSGIRRRHSRQTGRRRLAWRMPPAVASS